MDAAIAATGVTDPVTDSITNIVLSQGLMGVIAVVLIYFILQLRAELRDTRAVHKTEIAAKDALIYELMEERLKEARVGYDVANSTKSTLEALLVAVRTRGP